MRYIKFRAWDGEKIVDELLINFQDGEFEWLDGNLNGTEPHAWEEEGLMQFTGLQDKCGVDIYEGDIVNISGSGLCTVEISPYHGVIYESINKNMFGSNAHDVAAEQDDIYVVGNIYENKDLINEN